MPQSQFSMVPPGTLYPPNQMPQQQRIVAPPGTLYSPNLAQPTQPQQPTPPEGSVESIIIGAQKQLEELRRKWFAETGGQVMLPNSGFFGRHPKLSGAIESGLTAASLTPQSRTTGEGIANVVSALLRTPQAIRQTQEQQLMQPLQGAMPLMKLQQIVSEMQNQAAQRENLESQGALRQKQGTLYSQQIAAFPQQQEERTANINRQQAATAYENERTRLLREGLSRIAIEPNPKDENTEIEIWASQDLNKEKRIIRPKGAQRFTQSGAAIRPYDKMTDSHRRQLDWMRATVRDRYPNLDLEEIVEGTPLYDMLSREYTLTALPEAQATAAGLGRSKVPGTLSTTSQQQIQTIRSELRAARTEIARIDENEKYIHMVDPSKLSPSANKIITEKQKKYKSLQAKVAALQKEESDLVQLNPELSTPDINSPEALADKFTEALKNLTAPRRVLPK